MEANETYQVKRGVYGKLIVYYLRKNTGLSLLIDGEYPRIFIYLGEKVKNALVDIDKLYKCFDYYAIDKEMERYPYIVSALGIGVMNEAVKKTDAYKKYVSMERPLEYDKEKSFLYCYDHKTECKVLKDIDKRSIVEILVDFADHLIYEISHFSIDTSKIEKSAEFKAYENSIISPKLKHALLVGGYFLAKGALKAAVRQLGGDLNFGDNSCFDVEFDGSFDGDFDFDDSFYGEQPFVQLDGTDSDWASAINGWGIDGLTFQGKSFDGFEDLDKTISVPIMGGGGNETLYVYKKLGSNTIYVSDGNCFPISTSGHSWITVGSHRFDVSKIKAKL